MCVMRLMVVGFCLLASCRDAGEQTMDADTLASRIGVPLPAGVRIVGATSSDERDGMLRAKLELPPAQVLGFLTAANIRRLEGAGPDLLGPDDGFWDPHRAGPLRSAEVQLPGARFLLVALDESRSDMSIVYVMAYGT